MIFPPCIDLLLARARARRDAMPPTAGSGAQQRIGRVVVEIEGVMEPEVFIQLPHAIEELWDALRQLPLGWTQYDAFRYFFGPGAVERVSEFLDRDGRLELSFSMAGCTHLVRIVRVPLARHPIRPSFQADPPSIDR